MPSIPTYGFAELEPSILNTAKRRIVGLMDTTQEALTEQPAEDPTNGKQNTFLEELTEEIYTTIKDIEVLDSYINENSGVDELRLTSAGVPDTLRTLRPELKKGASQIALVNNALRKINATYERLRTNIEYTNLKIFTYFVNAVRILKKSALDFFAVVDDLIDNIRKAQGATSYIRPVINNDDEELETEAPPSSAIVPPFLSTPTPVLPPISLAPLPPPPPPPPPPPKPPTKAKILSFKVKVSSKAKTAGLDATQTADVLSLADDFVANNGRVADATEIDTLIADYLASSAPAPPLPPLPPAPAPPLPPAPAPPLPPASAPSTAPPIGTPAPAPAPAPAPPLPPIAVMGISPDVIDFQNRASDIMAKRSLINDNGIKKLKGAVDALQNKIDAGSDYSRELNTLKEKVFYHETPFIKVDRKKIPKSRITEHETLYSKYENEKKKGNSKIQKFIDDLVDFYNTYGLRADADYRIEPAPVK